MLTDPRSVLVAANNAVSQGDHDGFLAYCTDDVAWHFIGDRTIRGKAAVKTYMDTVYVEPPEFDAGLLIADAGHVVAIGRITITGADGRKATSDYCDVWRLRDGRLAELRAYVIETSGSGPRD
jgi:ketosteroid isomerase-like protein